MYDLWRGSSLGIPFFSVAPPAQNKASYVRTVSIMALLRSGSSFGTLVDAPFVLLFSLVMSGMTSTSIRRKKMFRAAVARAMGQNHGDHDFCLGKG